MPSVFTFFKKHLVCIWTE